MMPVRTIFEMTDPANFADLSVVEGGLRIEYTEDWAVPPEDFLEFADWIAAEAAKIRAAQKPEVKDETKNEGWIAWKGGKNPVPGKRVDIKLRDGSIQADTDSDWEWSHDPKSCSPSGQIIAYRVLGDA